MSKLNISEEERVILLQTLKKSSGKDIDRIRVILALGDGFSFDNIAKILRMDDSTIRRYLKIYQEKSLLGLLEHHYKGRSCQLDASQQEALINHLKSNVYQESKAIVAYIQKTFNVTYTVDGVTNLLHRLGFSYKKPSTFPGKADSQKQKEFIEQYQKLESEKAPEDQLYFIDGVHPMHNVQPAYGWFYKGEAAVLPTNTGRDRINLNGAYNVEKQQVIVRSDQTINAQSTIKLLEEIKTQQLVGKIHIICDNAKYYRCSLLTDYLSKPENQRIIMNYLPPYSPNLNCIERLWKFMKKKTVYNTYYEKFMDFEKAIKAFFTNIDQYKSELESLMTTRFHIVKSNRAFCNS